MSVGFADPAWMAMLARRRVPIPPSSPLVLWRPSQLGLAEDAPLTTFVDEGSLGYTLSPIRPEAPIFQTIAGIPAVRYGRVDGLASTAMGTGGPGVTSLPTVTGLFIFRPSALATVTYYLGDTASGAAGGSRLGAGVNFASDRPFLFRGALGHGPTPKPAADEWHYLVGHYNGASSTINIDGVTTAINVGTGILVNGYAIGGFRTDPANRYVGHLGPVGFWDGDRRVDAEVYAREVLGLPP